MTSVIAGVGYRNLRDHSLGVIIADDLGERTLSSGVAVLDLSYNPVAVAQWLESLPAHERPSRLVFVSAVERGREPGTVTAYVWNRELPDAARIQRAVEDAVTGVIYLDNTLIVLGWSGHVPADCDVVVVEVEPQEEAFGEELSPVLALRYERIVERVVALASDASAVAELACEPLGGVTSPSEPS